MFGFKADSKNETKKPAGLFASLRQRLSKTRENLSSGLADLLLGKKQIDGQLLEQLEDQLILGEILESDYKQLKWKIVQQLREAGETVPAITGSVQRAEVVDSLGRQFCHIPADQFIQGPDDEQGELMAAINMAKYPVTVEQFIEIVERGREIVPSLTLASDFIVGFCGETDDDFEQTAELLGITSRTVERDWRFARASLYDDMAGVADD